MATPKRCAHCGELPDKNKRGPKHVIYCPVCLGISGRSWMSQMASEWSEAMAVEAWNDMVDAMTERAKGALP